MDCFRLCRKFLTTICSDRQ